MNRFPTYPLQELNSANLANQRTKDRLQSIDVFILLLGILSSFFVEVVGQFYISEILLVLLFPFLWIRNRGVLLQDRLTGRILLFGFIWFISQVLTDLIRSTPTSDMMRGLAAILVFLLSFGSLYLLIENNIRRIQFFILGYAFGALVGLYVQPPDYFADEPWKFGYGFPIVLLVLLLISKKAGSNYKNLNKWVLPLLVLGGLSFYWNARALGTMIMLTAALIWLRNRKITGTFFSRLSLRNVFAGIFLVGLVSWGLSSLYGKATQAGYLGEEAQWKFVQQGGGQFGLLIGGRSEILVSTKAVSDSPWIGHGSWARNPKYRVIIYELIGLGYTVSEEQLRQYITSTDLIPTHSHIFQAWVWGGILGAIFWIVILGIIVRAFIQSNQYTSLLHIFVIFFSVAAVWDIFFSPFGSVMRLRWSFQLVIFLAAIYYANKTQQDKSSTKI